MSYQQASHALVENGTFQLTTSDLEVCDVVVTQFGKDSTQFLSGDDVTFVATATFKLTDAAYDQLKTQGSDDDLADHPAIFQICNNATVKSSFKSLQNCNLDEWLSENYEFNFILDTQPLPPSSGKRAQGQEPQKGQASMIRDRPWVHVLNTARLTRQFADIDATITPREAVVKRGAVPPEVTLPASDAMVGCRIVVDGHTKSARDLIGKSFKIPLQSDTVDAVLVFEVMDPLAGSGYKSMNGLPSKVQLDEDGPSFLIAACTLLAQSVE